MLIAGLLATLGVLVCLAPPADAAYDRRAKGQTNRDHGFPKWYQDSRGLRVAPCLEKRLRCGFETRAPGFPAEFVYWSAEASMPVGNGGRARLVMAVEGAFGGEDEAVRDGDQITTGAIIVRARGLRPNTVYRITHPYGKFRARSDGRGEIRRIFESGCHLEAPGDRCKFARAMRNPVFGGFLRWDPTVRPRAPKGFLGHPEVAHRVVGSPKGTNFFRISGRRAGGRGDNAQRTRKFSVIGKVRKPIPTTVSLGAKPSRVKAGRGVTLSGRLRSVLGKNLADRKVTVMKKPAGKKNFRNVAGGTLTTRRDGTFSLRVRNVRNDTVYLVKFPGKRGALWPSRDTDRVRVFR